MPYRYYFSNDSGLYTDYFGHLTNDEAIDCLQQKISDPRFTDVKYSINDFSGVTQFSLTKGCMRQISEMNIEASKTNSALLAIAINPTALSHGMTRMWQGYTPDDETGWTTVSVPTWEEAIDCVHSILGISIQIPEES